MERNYLLLTDKFNAAVIVALLCLVFALGLSVYRSFTAGAQQIDEDAISLAISPQLLELSANPGDSIDSTFRLTNGSADSIEIEVVARNFLPQGEDGAVELTEETTAFSLSQWITIDPEQTTIASRQTADFKMNITVPDNAEPGGHFGSLVFRTIPPEQAGDVALVSQEIAPVILVKIAGDVDESAEIASFRSLKNIWSNQDPIQFETRVLNTGNVHFRPSGQIEIKNIFGNTVERIEIDQRNVIPDAVRRVITDWNEPGFRFGRYSASLTVIYGEDNQILTSETSFTVFPYQTIAPIAAAVVFIGFMGWRFRERITLALRVLSGKSTGE